MKLLLATLAFAACAALVAAQVRPQISETFEGEGYTHIVTSQGDVWGLGRWVIDEPNGHALESWTFPTEHRHHSMHFLKRYDLGFDYALEWERHPSPHVSCRKHAVKPPMPAAWAWVREARSHGKHVIDGTTYNVWGHHAGGVDLEVAVSEHDASRPHYFMRRSATDHRVYHFISWATFKPNATWFNVPDVCKNATELTDLDLSNDNTEAMVGSCSTAAAAAENMVTVGSEFSGASFIGAAFEKAGLSVPSLESGSSCDGGARIGDVFVDGNAAAVYLGNDRFAECGRDSQCSIIGWRPFSGFCRRFC